MDPTSRWSVRIPELDGIRGTAIAMVLVWHYFTLGAKVLPAPASFLSRSLIPLRLMWSGVDLFFVLSGFLIGGILLDARGSSNYFKVFYVRRFFRIVPIYFAVLLIFPTCLFVLQAFYPGNYSWLNENSLPWYSFWTLTQNFWMAHSNTLGSNMFAVTWSLAIEEQFYLTLPLIIRFFSRRCLSILVASGIILAPILRTAILLISPTSWIAAFALMPCRADALLFGVLAAIILRKEQSWEALRNSGRYFTFLIFLLLAGITFLVLKSPAAYDSLMQKLGYSWIAFFYATVLVYVLTHRESILAFLFRNSLLRWMGKLAYGIYLIHQAVQGFVYALFWGKAPEIVSLYTLLATLASLILTLVITTLSWRYFEMPLIHIGHRLNYEFKERHLPQLADGTVPE
jgi:peptidoglycan/LPS O-acetylase OafA/YrhL